MRRSRVHIKLVDPAPNPMKTKLVSTKRDPSLPVLTIRESGPLRNLGGEWTPYSGLVWGLLKEVGMPLFDLRCKDCKLVLRDQLIKSRDRVKWRTCPMCHAGLEIIPMSAAIEVKGYSAKNGYADEKPNNS